MCSRAAAVRWDGEEIRLQPRFHDVERSGDDAAGETSEAAQLQRQLAGWDAIAAGRGDTAPELTLQLQRAVIWASSWLPMSLVLLLLLLLLHPHPAPLPAAFPCRAYCCCSFFRW